jgi:hypothetical protein
MSVAYSSFQVDLLSILLWDNLLCPSGVVVNSVRSVSHYFSSPTGNPALKGDPSYPHHSLRPGRPAWRCLNFFYDAYEPR